MQLSTKIHEWSLASLKLYIFVSGLSEVNDEIFFVGD